MERFCPWCLQSVPDRLCVSPGDAIHCKRKLAADVKAGRISDRAAAVKLAFVRPDRKPKLRTVE